MNDEAEDLLDALRQPGARAESARGQLAFAGGQSENPRRQRLRDEVAAALGTTLRPTDRGVVRWLLQQEIEEHKARGHGASEALYTLVAALARFAQADDALLIWQARQATPESREGVDVEQMARAGFDAVRALLARMAAQSGPQRDDARQALAWLESGATSGALDDLPGYFLWADERFGLLVSGST